MGDSGEVETGLHESSHGVVKNSWTLILGDVMVGVITRDEQEAVFAIAWREGGKRDRLLSTNSQMDQGSYTNEEVSLNQRILLDNHLETHIPARFACRACLRPGSRGGCERRGNERLRTGFWSRPWMGGSVCRSAAGRTENTYPSEKTVADHRNGGDIGGLRIGASPNLRG